MSPVSLTGLPGNSQHLNLKSPLATILQQLGSPQAILTEVLCRVKAHGHGRQAQQQDFVEPIFADRSAIM